MSDYRQKLPVWNQFDGSWDLIAKVKSQRSTLDHDMDLLDRRRNLRDVCDWAQAKSANSTVFDKSRGRLLVHEKLKVAEIQVKKNVQSKLEEMQQLKVLQAKMTSKDSRKFSKINQNVKHSLSGQKINGGDCECCTKKNSLQKRLNPGPAKVSFSVPSSKSARTRPRPLSTSCTLPSTPIANDTIITGNPFIPIYSPTRRPSPPESLKKKLRATCSTLHKVKLLSLSQRNNVPTTTRGTNTGSNIGDDRIGMENVVHIEEKGDCDTKRPQLSDGSRVLSMKSLPGVDVPRSVLMPRDVREYNSPNVGHFDVWSTAEIGVPNDLDDTSMFNPRSRVIIQPLCDADDGDDWLITARQWLEEELVDYVVSKLRLNDSRDYPVTDDYFKSRSPQSFVKSDSHSNNPTSKEYTDTFECSETVPSPQSLEDPQSRPLGTSISERLSGADLPAESSVSVTSKTISVPTNETLDQDFPGITCYTLSSVDSHSQIQENCRREDVEVTHLSVGGNSSLSPIGSLSDPDDIGNSKTFDQEVVETEHPSSCSVEFQSPIHQSVSVKESVVQGLHENIPEVFGDINAEDRSGLSGSSLGLKLIQEPNKNEKILSPGGCSKEDSISQDPRLIDALHIRDPITDTKADVGTKAELGFTSKILEEEFFDFKEVQMIDSCKEDEIDSPTTMSSEEFSFQDRSHDQDSKSQTSLEVDSHCATVSFVESQMSVTKTSTDISNDCAYSLGEMIPIRQLRRVAFNRMKRMKTRTPEVTSQLSTVSNLDGSDDPGTDSDAWGISSSTLWSEGEVRLDPLLGAILKGTSLTRDVPIINSPGEIRIPSRTNRTPQASDSSMTIDRTISMLKSEDRSLGELNN